MFLLILRDLQYRRWRVGLTILLMAIVMTLLFLMSGLVAQFNAEPEFATAQAAGGSNWVVAEGTGGPFTSPQPVDASRFDDVEGDPILIALGSVNDLRVSIVGRSFSQGVPELVAGRHPVTAGEIVLDVSGGFELGDQVELGGLDATIVGTTEDATVLAGIPLAFVTLDFAQDAAIGGQDLVLAKLTPAPPPDLAPGLKVLTPEMVVADTLLPLDGAIASVTLVRALLWLITVIVIGAIIYITALERTRDFAVLKAVGGKTRDLGLSLLVQGVLMTLIAVAIAGVLQSFIGPSFPLKVRVPASAWVVITVGAAVAALAAGAAGVLRVRSTSPAEAFG